MTATSQRNSNYICKLPAELQLQIAKYLSVSTHVRLSSTCRGLRNVHLPEIVSRIGKIPSDYGWMAGYKLFALRLFLCALTPGGRSLFSLVATRFSQKTLVHLFCACVQYHCRIFEDMFSVTAYIPYFENNPDTFPDLIRTQKLLLSGACWPAQTSMEIMPLLWPVHELLGDDSLLCHPAGVYYALAGPGLEPDLPVIRLTIQCQKDPIAWKRLEPVSHPVLEGTALLGDWEDWHLAPVAARTESIWLKLELLVEMEVEKSTDFDIDCGSKVGLEFLAHVMNYYDTLKGRGA